MKIRKGKKKKEIEEGTVNKTPPKKHTHTEEDDWIRPPRGPAVVVTTGAHAFASSSYMKNC